MAELSSSTASIAADSPIANSLWRPLRLATLVRLRWLAIGGQTISVLVVYVLLRFELPIIPAFALIGLSALINIWLASRFGSGFRLRQNAAGALLAFDSVQLGGLLWLTGGLQNPFCLLLLAPVSVSATSLRPNITFWVGAVTAMVATILAFWHMPLPWYDDRTFVIEPIYVAGLWVSLLCGVAFIAAYTNRVAHEGRQLAQALAATELALSRQQQLQALDGMAAAAAHELGTPLSTIALAARELRDDLDGSAAEEDLDLIISQVGRCRAILGRLRSLDNEEEGSPFAQIPLGQMIAEITQPYETLGKTILHEAQPGEGEEPVLPRSTGVIYGLGNLVENAVHFAHESVKVTMGWDDTTVWLSILDDGPGFATDLLARLGEPYLTSRAKSDWTRDASSPGGLGLGIFIAKTLLERSGARLTFSNARALGSAKIDISWPRDRLLHDPE